MEEGQVSVDGVTYALDKPFLVIATQNPIEIQGTFPLPEAQLDRFFVRLKMGYPDTESETRMLTGRVSQNPLDALAPVLSGEEIVEAQAAVRMVKVGQAVASYIVRLAEATRNHEKIRLGVSPRGALALMHGAQAHAAMAGRDFAEPEDVKAVAADIWCHRLICRGTIEDRIDAMLKDKRRMADDLFSGGPEQWLMNMSAEELNNLFSGSPC